MVVQQPYMAPSSALLQPGAQPSSYQTYGYQPTSYPAASYPYGYQQPSYPAASYPHGFGPSAPPPYAPYQQVSIPCQIPFLSSGEFVFLELLFISYGRAAERGIGGNRPRASRSKWPYNTQLLKICGAS